MSLPIGFSDPAWLWLARWASQSVPGYNLAFVCNTGHEYEYLGAADNFSIGVSGVTTTYDFEAAAANVVSAVVVTVTGTVPDGPNFEESKTDVWKGLNPNPSRQ